MKSIIARVSGRNKTNNLVSYSDWNQALFRKLYIDVEPNQIVYLFVNDDLIQEIGEGTLGIPREHAMESFCYTVQSYIRDKSEFFERAVKRGKRWYSQENGEGSPPFLAVLGLCVLAATHMEPDEELNVGGGNYYVRLRTLLGMEGRGKPKNFENTVVLWNLLSEWQDYHEGQYGYTHSFPFEVAKYTGYPRSQCLIRSSEIPVLHEFFQRMGYSPSLNISEDQLEKDVEVYLRGRGGRLVDQFFRNKALRKAIVICIKNELSKWNPSRHKEMKPRIELSKKPSRQNIRLLLDIEESFFASIVSAYYWVTSTDINKKAEERPPFVYKNGTYLYQVDANHNLLSDYEFKFLDNHSTWVFKAKKFFVFYKNPALGLHEWEDQTLLRKGEEYVFLYHDSIREELDTWLQENCCTVDDTYEDAELNLPIKWCLLKLRIPLQINDELWFKDYGIRVESSIETFIRIDNGLPLGGGNRWLFYEPWPQLEVKGEPRSVVSVNNVDTFTVMYGEAVIPLNHLFSRPGSYNLQMSYTRSKNIVLQENNTDFLNLLPQYERPQNLITDYGSVDISGMHLMFQGDTPSFPQIFQPDGRSVLLTTKKRSISRSISKKRLKEQPFARSFRRNNIRLQRGVLSNSSAVDRLLEYLTVRGHGNWEAYCIGVERIIGTRDNREIHYIRKNLSRLGLVEFVKRSNGNGYDWFVVPPTATFLPSPFSNPFIVLSGGRTSQWINNLMDGLPPNVKSEWTVPSSDNRVPTTIFFTSNSLDLLEEVLQIRGVRVYRTIDYFAHDLVQILPSLEQIIDEAPECGELTLTRGYKYGWDCINHTFELGHASIFNKHENPFEPIQYSIGKQDDSIRRVPKDIGLTWVASVQKLSILRYSSYIFKIMSPYQLPEMYDRVLVSCSGMLPKKVSGYWEYHNVPLEIALLVSFKLNLTLNF